MITRNILQASCAALLLLAGSAISAPAQVRVDAEAGPFVGGTLFFSGPEQYTIARQEASPLMVHRGQFQNAVAVGVTGGLRFNERYGLEGTYAWVPTRMRAEQGLEQHGGQVDVHSIRYGASFVYHFAPRTRIQPFASVGVAGETLSWGSHLAWERESDVMANVAFGGSMYLRDGVSLRVRVGRDMLHWKDSLPRDHVMVTAGLTFRERIR